MAAFARLIALLALLWVVPSWAFDSVPEQSQVRWSCVIGGKTGVSMSSGASACSIAVDAVNKVTVDGNQTTTYSYEFQGCTVSTPTSGTCNYNVNYRCVYNDRPGGVQCSSGSFFSPAGYGGATVVACPEGAVDNGGSPKVCSCPLGFKPSADGKKCEQYTCPPSGGYSAITQPDQKVANAGDGMCAGGCGLQPSSWKVGQDGQIWATWPFKTTGKFCGGDPNPTKPAVDTGEKNTQNPAPVACGINQCPGTVNGASICVPCKGQSDQGSSSAASAPAGSASGAGDTTTTKQTTCDGVNCTTTTTTKDGSGAVIGSSSDTKPQQSFCQENPASPLCKQSSFAGACSAVACEGDAVMCAIAADQYKRNCQWFDDSRTGALEAAGDAALAAGSMPADHPLSQAVSESMDFSARIDQMDRLAGGCPQDVTVSVLGRSVVMPLSRSCAPLQTLGALAVAVSMLMAVFIVFKG